MVNLPLFESDAPPAVRRPNFEVSFGGGGIGGLVSGVAAAVGIGSAADPWKKHLVSLTVETGLAPFVDAAVMTLAVGEEAPPVAVGDQGAVSLGYEDDATELIFTGRIDSLRHDLRGRTRILATTAAVSLARLRHSASYEQQTAGDIVNDLAGLVGVETDTVEDGASFPFYVVDDRRNACEHIAELARRSNYVAYFTTAGKLRFVPPEDGEPVRTFAFGVDILTLEVTDVAATFNAVTAIGEGAAGRQGQEAWSWLVKDPSSISANAGGGDVQRVVPDGALRSVESAQSAADAVVSNSTAGQLTGRMLVPGAPRVTVGSTLEITDAPDDAQNGRFQVHRVWHNYSMQAGFTTQIAFSKAGDAGGGLLGGLL